MWVIPDFGILEKNLGEQKFASLSASNFHGRAEIACLQIDK
jgi:hypothetical protein